MAIQTYYFYQPGSIDGIPGSFSAGTAVDINTSTMTVVATRPIGSTTPTIVQLISAQATASTSATLQNAATSTGIGTALSLLGMGSVAFTISGTFSATITWEGSEDGTNFSAMLATPYGSSTPATTTTATGVFIAGCAGLQQVRAHITAYTSGSITVTAHAVPLSGGSGSGGGGGGGAVTIADGADTTQGTTTDAAWSGSGSGTAIAILKKLVAELAATLNVSVASALPAGTNVIGHTIVDSGAITANAGTNLNTSLLALESGGNLASAKTDLDSIKTYTSAFADTSASGSVTNDGDVVSIALPGGQATALMQITTSNLNGTLLFEGSPDSGTTYYSTFANQVGTSTIASSVAGTGGSQAAGAWRANVAGFTNFRVRLHPTTSGTATIKIILTQGVHNVAINNATTLGQATSANSAPVVPASDYVSPVKSSRLEIAGQSTSIVNGANTDLIPATDVTGYTMAVLQITGTWSMTLQAQQCNDNANFLQIECINAQTLISTNNLRSTMTANGMYLIPLTGRYLRVRATAWVSNASCVGTLELYTTPPPFVQAAMATYLSLGPQGSGGTTDFHLISAASTNSNNIKNSQGQVYGYDFGNNGASDAWVKFYNKATAPTVGTDSVFRTVYVPKGGRASFHTTTGIALSTGIGIGITGGAADNDTTAVGAAQVTCEVDYN
jgi:hypothetical protein